MTGSVRAGVGQTGSLPLGVLTGSLAQWHDLY